MISQPTLYKLTSIGNIQYWKISVDQTKEGYGKLITEYGKLGTDKPQTTIDILKEGKNIGKISETTAYEQAIKEAAAKHEKQLKSGYVRSIEEAKDGQIDEIIEGGILPMLAHKFKDHSDKINFPCLGQPKLDGIRVVAIVKDGTCSLWSRTRKKINSLPHLIEEIESLKISNIIFDGELYNEHYRDNFEEIVSLVRPDEPKHNCTEVELHLYDIVDTLPQYQRLKNLETLIYNNKLNYIKFVETPILEMEDDVVPFFDYCISKGFEGAMLRNMNGLYVNKRSYDLQKVKSFDEDEFKIIGIKEGRGKLIGHGIFECVTHDNKEFDAKMKGDTSKLKEYFENPALWKNKLLTVQYQGYTKKGKPRFGVGKAIRDYD